VSAGAGARYGRERETDGRWMAEIPELPGVMAYGASKDEASTAVLVLALRVAADRIEHGEPVPESLLRAFQTAA